MVAFRATYGLESRIDMSAQTYGITDKAHKVVTLPIGSKCSDRSMGSETDQLTDGHVGL